MLNCLVHRVSAIERTGRPGGLSMHETAQGSRRPPHRPDEGGRRGIRLNTGAVRARALTRSLPAAARCPASPGPTPPVPSARGPPGASTSPWPPAAFPAYSSPATCAVANCWPSAPSPTAVPPPWRRTAIPSACDSIKDAPVYAQQRIHRRHPLRNTPLRGKPERLGAGETERHGRPPSKPAKGPFQLRGIPSLQAQNPPCPVPAPTADKAQKTRTGGRARVQAKPITAKTPRFIKGHKWPARVHVSPGLRFFSTPRSLSGLPAYWGYTGSPPGGWGRAPGPCPASFVRVPVKLAAIDIKKGPVLSDKPHSSW